MDEELQNSLIASQQFRFSQDSAYVSQELIDDSGRTNFDQYDKDSLSQNYCFLSQEKKSNLDSHDSRFDSTIYDPNFVTENDDCIRFIPNNLFYSLVDQFYSIQQISIDNFKYYIKNNFTKLTKNEVLKKLTKFHEDFTLLTASKPNLREKSAKKITIDAENFFLNGKNKRKRIKSRKKFIKIKIFKSFSKIIFSNETGLTYDRLSAKHRSLKINREQYNFVFEKLRENIEKDHFFSPRDLFYRNLRLFKSPVQIYSILKNICCTLNLTRFDLMAIQSKNGFVHGDLQYEYNKTIFRCNDPESFTLIPSYIDNISKFHSNARFILVVEKFTAFANLIASKINKKFRIIMVTGCGYPDFKTRKFVQKLWFELRLPIFALIDGDSYGVDIALSYKYGSVSSAYQNHELIVPEIQWLGVLADDIEEFELQGIDFSPRELKKFQALQQRPDVRENIPWLTQMIKLRDKGIKVEIQALLDYSSNFLVDFYLPFKLFCGKWI